MKIEAGKYYVTRGGDVVGPMVYADVSHQYKWRKNKDAGWLESYTDDGFYVSELGQHSLDLIKEHVMPKFKVGDRVKWGSTAGSVKSVRNRLLVMLDGGPEVEFEPEELEAEIIPQIPASLDLTKPVQTRDGRKVRLLCTDGPGEWPVIGIVEGDNDTTSWRVDGSSFRDRARTSIDLINTPAAPRTFERWFNVYRSGVGDGYNTRLEADGHVLTGRIACKRVVFTEGEWDG